MGAKRVTPQEAVEMYRLYQQLGTYSAVAERIGRDAKTVAKYVTMKGVPSAMRIAVQNLMQKA